MDKDLNLNTDFTQYKSYGEAIEAAEKLSRLIITDVQTDLANQSLEDLQKHDMQLEDNINGIHGEKHETK